MGNEANKKFTWVIKNFSSLPPFGSKTVQSDKFVAGGCNWCLLAFPKGYNSLDNNLSLYLAVPNPGSLPSGWRRHAKFSFTIVNKTPGELSQLRETQRCFDQKNSTFGFEYMIRLSKLKSEFLVNNELKIVAEVDVLEVVGKLDVPAVVISNIVDVNGFQVLASQVETMNSLFEKHPNVATNVRAKNPHLRTTYLNTLLCVAEILSKSTQELSSSDLAGAYSSLRYVSKAGFNVDWLEKALKEAGVSRVPGIKKELNDMALMRADMDALLEFLE